MTENVLPQRVGEITRETKETKIHVKVNLDGTGHTDINVPIGFLQHMFETLGRHARFDLTVHARGDLHVDQHHLVEDCGLVIGQALARALGDYRGIQRMGHAFVPMDEALAMSAIDLGGRAYVQYRCRLKRRFCGDFDTDLLPDFFQALATGVKANIVVRVLQGRNDHHKIEAMFKALARALYQAVSRDPASLKTPPSTKGVIDT